MNITKTLFAALSLTAVLGHTHDVAAQNGGSGGDGCDTREAHDCPIVKPVDTYAKSCPAGSDMKSCVSFAAMPPAELECTGLGGWIICEAWPSAADGAWSTYYSYSWSIGSAPFSSGNGDPHSPLFEASCTGYKWVNVTVSTTTGQSSSASYRVFCNGQ